MPIVVSMPELLAAEALMQLRYGAVRPPWIANAATDSPSYSKANMYSKFSICLNCRSDKKNISEIGTQTDANENTDKSAEASAPTFEMELHTDVSTGVDLIKQHPLNQNNTATTPVKKEVNHDKWHPKKRKGRVIIKQEVTDLVTIGGGTTTVPRRLLKHINWKSYTIATRTLLTTVFPRSVLATHSLTGKPSPAFPGKPAKERLDPERVRDIVQEVVERCGVPEGFVRTSITTKCADEAKMARGLDVSKNQFSKRLKENIVPL